MQMTNVSTRGRPYLACTGCRVRKTKCSGDKPECARCQQLSLTCTYPTHRQVGRRALAGTRAPSVRSSGALRTQSASAGRASRDLTDDRDPPVHDAELQPSPRSQQSAIRQHRDIAIEPASPAPLHEQYDGSQHFRPPAVVIRPDQTFVPPPELDRLQLNHYQTVSTLHLNPLPLSLYQLGATAVHPGVNAVSYSVSLADPSRGSSARAMGPFEHLVFDERGMPPEAVYRPLLAIFFEVALQHFPSLHPEPYYQRLANGSMSSFVLCCMCAYAARFSPLVTIRAYQAGNPFLCKAGELLYPLLAFPSTDCMCGLTLMAWYHYGLGNMSAFWSHIGMAMRMAEDLGIPANSDSLFENQTHYNRAQLHLWALIIGDRLLALGLGRPCTVSRVHAQPHHPAFTTCNVDWPLAGDTPPFKWIASLMSLWSRLVALFHEPSSLIPNEIANLRADLTIYQASIPCELRSSNGNFRYWAEQNKGGAFVTLHSLVAGLSLFLNHDLFLRKLPAHELSEMASQADLSAAMSSAQSLCDLLAYAEATTPLACAASPHIVQMLHTIGLAFIDPQSGSAPSVGELLSQHLFVQNIRLIVDTLNRIQRYWYGARVYRDDLIEKGHGLIGNIERDSIGCADGPSLVAMPELGVLRRQQQLTWQRPLISGDQRVWNDQERPAGISDEVTSPNPFLNLFTSDGAGETLSEGVDEFLRNWYQTGDDTIAPPLP